MYSEIIMNLTIYAKEGKYIVIDCSTANWFNVQVQLRIW